ncbi:MAG: polymerase sigma factor SigD [Frankiales bacterium]|nr:polymerase sigma factor SigD [Frankiales bacterium]
MPSDLNTLVTTWQAGDRSAAERALTEIRSAVLTYLLARRLPLHEAEDVTQEVCLAVIAAVPGWTDRGRSFWSMVFTIASRRLVDRTRWAVRAPVLAAVEDHADTVVCQRPQPEQLVLQDEQADQVSRLLAVLPCTQRDVVVLRTLVGLTVADTAAALGLAHGSVHVLHHRAMTKLRRHLQESS